MDTKYYTIEDIKKLGDDKLTEIIKNNILKSENKDFIINLTFTYKDNLKNILSFNEDGYFITIFNNDIYVYDSIYYDKKEENYVAFGIKINENCNINNRINEYNILYNIFNHKINYIKDIYNSINININFPHYASLLFIYNEDSIIDINNKYYYLYENPKLLFQKISNDDSFEYQSYILPDTKFYASLKLSKFNYEHIEHNDNDYELRLYINKIEIPKYTFIKMLLKKSYKYDYYMDKYILQLDGKFKPIEKLQNMLNEKDENKKNQLINDLNNEEKEEIKKNIKSNRDLKQIFYIIKLINKNNIKIKMYEQYQYKDKIEKLKQINNELNNTLKTLKTDYYKTDFIEIYNILNKLENI